MKARSRYLLLAMVGGAVFAVAWVAVWARPPAVESAIAVARPPRIWPDYSGTVIPPSIAPLNFAVREEGERFFVRIRSEAGAAMDIFSRSEKIAIPAGPWKSLLDANRGKELLLDVYAEADGQWRRYQSIRNRIAEEDIDGYLVYRRIRPLFSEYRRVGIYQRDLTSYAESVVIDGTSLNEGCVNCHSFANNSPQRMLIGMRSSQFGSATLLATGDGEVTKIGAKFGYTAWHPSGRIAAYSIHQQYQLFHSTGTDMRDIVDMDAALAYYVVEARNVKMVPRASDKERLETYPTWSPDGRYLYYCSAPILWTDRRVIPPARYAEVKYDLMRIRYDVDADAWGEPETVLSAKETGLSILIPRISPDGRFLLFCMCRYGGFPAFQPSSDLYMMDLTTRKYGKLDINSDFSESWHSWSSNGRWIAFSSKRRATPFSRCYLSFVDPSGKAYKPFLLPQGDPEYYDSFLETVSVPELITGPVPVTGEALARAAQSPEAIVVDRLKGPAAGDPLAPSERADR